MTRIGVVLGFLLALTAGASAQDEPLPDSVAQAYLAYENALTAQDEDAAFAAAAAAWRAAREERIDAELIGILAENYGLLAQARGAHGEAYEAWRNAAEISDRLQVPEPERALRWYNAGVAAFGNGDVGDANRCLTRSVRAQPVGMAVRDEDLLGNTHYLIAVTTAQLGRLSGVGRHARAAISAFQASGRAYDSMYADAYYLSAVAYYSSGDDVESVVDFNMARGIFATLAEAGQENNLRVLELWLLLARERLSELQLQRIDAQLAISGFPPPEPGPSRVEDENNRDSTPIRRIGPAYPREAAQRGIEGVTLVQFNLSADGTPEDIQVVASIPTGVFDAASVQAVARWHYDPALLNGEPVPRRGLETSFLFQLR